MLFENGLRLRVGFLEAEYQTYFRTGFHFWVMQAYLGYRPHSVTVDMNHNMDISSPEYVTVILDFRWRGALSKDLRFEGLDLDVEEWQALSPFNGVSVLWILRWQSLLCDIGMTSKPSTLKRKPPKRGHMGNR